MDSVPGRSLPGDNPLPGVFGPGALDELPNAVRDHGLDRIFLVSGRSSFRASGADRIVPALRASGQVEVWAEFSPNTDVADLVRGLQVA